MLGGRYMYNLEEAIEKIKTLECPAGDLENSVALILEDYKVASPNEIKMSLNKQEDKDGIQAYKAEIASSGERIIVLAETGFDGYVTKVVDAYIY
jgi:hypothetical protein